MRQKFVYLVTDKQQKQNQYGILQINNAKSFSESTRFYYKH